MSNTKLILTQSNSESNLTPTAQPAPIPPISPRITPRQLALLVGRKAVCYILFGEPDPRTFDRADLKTAAAMLGEMLAETEATPEASNV